jgi:acyl carrier protein
METFIQHLAEALNLQESAISPEQKLRELPNWDSLAILTTLSMLDTEYDVSMSGAELQACDTVADLHSRVEARRDSQA